MQWLVLMHHFPRDPGALRVKVWRRLQTIGAVAIKNSVYVLPKNDQTQEDFEWLLREITAGGAEAVILESTFINGMSDQQVRGLFDEAREADYEELANEVREYETGLPRDAGHEATKLREARAQLARFRKRLSEIEAIDFFGANGREAAEALIAALDERLSDPGQPTRGDESMQPARIDDLKGKVWVTRRNVHVDRIATAWMIRRWIDPAATFKFTSDKDYSPSRDEVRFDMFEAEFTHEGNKCTFEVLLAKAGLDDPALERVAEIVHDIDLKDHKYNRDETAGIANLLAGIVARIDDDEDRIERGGEMFEDLYRFFQEKAE